MNISKLSKKERAILMSIFRKNMPSSLTFRKIAIECDVSEALVSSFFAGINTNQKVLDFVIDNVDIETPIPDYLIEKMKEHEPVCSN